METMAVILDIVALAVGVGFLLVVLSILASVVVLIWREIW